MAIGQELRAQRLAHGMTQEQLAERLGVKNSGVLWPLRVAVSGRQSTPGGATELCAILGSEESTNRVRKGIALLEAAVSSVG